MRKLVLALVAVACFVAAGCSMTTSYIGVPGAQYVDPAAQFSAGNVTDSSGFQFAPDDKDAFNLAEAMKASLHAELDKHLNPNASMRYSVDVDILRYAPGNAGLRWLMPGLGATKLSVKATVFDEAGNECAIIPVERTIAAGGGFTIGAYRTVFDEVAAAIVQLLKNADKRTPPKNE